ncbi:MAG: hypothetical protein ACREBC_27205 [Pyrinomonadaceae bacterium]
MNRNHVIFNVAELTMPKLVGWVERSETHNPAAQIVMGFGYRLHPSYAG